MQFFDDNVIVFCSMMAEKLGSGIAGSTLTTSRYFFNVIRYIEWFQLYVSVGSCHVYDANVIHLVTLSCVKRITVFGLF